MSLHDDMRAFEEEIQRPNILLLGRLGVGKTTLINSVFGRRVAEVGVSFGGLTQSYVRHSPPGIPITIYDSAGFQARKEDEFVRETLTFLSDCQKKGPNEQVHLCWYVVSAPSARFELFESDLIDRLNDDGIPVVIVMSQCDRASEIENREMLKILKGAKFKKAYDIIQVAAAPLEVKGSPICEPFGLEQLVTTTERLLPAVYRDAFIAAQFVNIKAKRATANTYVTVAAAAVLATGPIPIPFTTVAATFFAQKNLAARLATLFGFDNVRHIVDLHKEAMKSPQAKWTAVMTTLLDFSMNPGTSTVGGVAAAAYMTKVGLALASTFEDMAKLELERPATNEELERLLKLTFKKKCELWRTMSKEEVEKFRREYLDGR